MENVKFAHIGWAVASIEKAEKDFEVLGYGRFGNVCHDTGRNVDLLLMSDNSGLFIELVAPASDDSPVSQIVKKNGATPYHICCSVCRKDWEELTKRLKTAGFMLIQKPAPAPLFNGKDVAFFYSKNIGLVEFVLA